MRIVEKYYYTVISRFFLKLLGIWPRDRSRLVLLQRVLIIISTVTFVCMQLSIFITTRYDMILFIKTMSVAFPFIIIVVKYCFFILKARSVRNLHYRIQNDWKIMRDKLESEIIQKYAHYGQYYTTLIFLFAGFLTIIIVFIQFYPIIFDIISPLDEPRSCKLIITVEYFVSQDKYIYTKILHEILITILCGSMILTTSMQMIVFIFHCFGMFKIASHRMRYSVEDNVLQNISNFKKERAICKNLIHAVIAHRRAMKFSYLLTSIFNVPYCIIAILGILSISVNIFRFLDTMTVSKNLEDAVVSFLIIIAHLVYMFIATYCGQKITDFNYEIFEMVYSTSWYLIPISSRKLILFILQKAGKEFNLKIGFILVANVENFTTLLNNALSYVAVMFSIH